MHVLMTLPDLSLWKAWKESVYQKLLTKYEKNSTNKLLVGETNVCISSFYILWSFLSTEKLSSVVFQKPFKQFQFQINE